MQIPSPKFRLGPTGIKWKICILNKRSQVLCCVHTPRHHGGVLNPPPGKEGDLWMNLAPSPKPPIQVVGIWKKEEQLGYGQEGITGWGHGCAWRRVFRGVRCGGGE